jgi:hypothetical protein
VRAQVGEPGDIWWSCALAGTLASKTPEGMFNPSTTGMGTCTPTPLAGVRHGRGHAHARSRALCWQVRKALCALLLSAEALWPLSMDAGGG